MKGSPLNFTGEALVGLVFEMVGVLSNQMHLSFGGGETAIDVFGAYTITVGDRVGGFAPGPDDEGPRFDALLYEALDREVNAVAVSPEGHFTVTLEDGARITVENSVAEDESYRLTTEAGEVVV